MIGFCKHCGIPQYGSVASTRCDMCHRPVSLKKEPGEVFAVVLHSSGSTYVVRNGKKKEDGSIYIPSPYNNSIPVQVFSSRVAADRLADKLTFGEIAKEIAK